MKGRFLVWCLLVVVWVAVLAGCYALVEQFGLGEWQGFVVLVPVLLLVRFTVQRFLSKGGQQSSE